MSTMLLSIKPNFVESILEGKKQFEFRKNRCRADVTRIVIYSSSPQKQVVAEAEIEEILEDTPDNIWDKAKNAAGISKDFFDTYYSGRNVAVAYHLKNVRKFEEPRSLIDYGIKCAPQSFAYIREG